MVCCCWNPTCGIFFSEGSLIPPSSVPSEKKYLEVVKTVADLLAVLNKGAAGWAIKHRYLSAALRSTCWYWLCVPFVSLPWLFAGSLMRLITSLWSRMGEAGRGGPKRPEAARRGTTRHDAARIYPKKGERNGLKAAAPQGRQLAMHCHGPIAAEAAAVLTQHQRKCSTLVRVPISQ